LASSYSGQTESGSEGLRVCGFIEAGILSYIRYEVYKSAWLRTMSMSTIKWGTAFAVDFLPSKKKA
jgi:hypothetical protein